MKAEPGWIAKKVEGILGSPVNNPNLFLAALTHSSYANEHLDEGAEHNERLEFLGDAVLELVVSEYLYRAYPDLPEGDLTKVRAGVVCEPTLAKKARELGVGNLVLLGRGEEMMGGRERDSLLADVFEALTGALYLDRGLEATRSFIVRTLAEEIDSLVNNPRSHDFKSMLQELVQQRDHTARITYQVVQERGPDHNKVFEVVVKVNGRLYGCGRGKSKKGAEQQAAAQALEKLG